MDDDDMPLFKGNAEVKEEESGADALFPTGAASDHDQQQTTNTVTASANSFHHQQHQQQQQQQQSSTDAYAEQARSEAPPNQVPSVTQQQPWQQRHASSGPAPKVEDLSPLVISSRTLGLSGFQTGPANGEYAEPPSSATAVCLVSQTLVATGHDNGLVSLWNRNSLQLVCTLSGHTGRVTSLATTDNNGAWLVSGSQDNTLRVWDVNTFRCYTMLQGHTAAITSLTAIPNTNMVASGSEDATVCIWDIEHRMCVTTLQGHTDTVADVAAMPSGSQVVSLGTRGQCRVWDTPTGEHITLTKNNTHIHAIATSVHHPDTIIALQRTRQTDSAWTVVLASSLIACVIGIVLMATDTSFHSAGYAGAAVCGVGAIGLCLCFILRHFGFGFASGPCTAVHAYSTHAPKRQVLVSGKYSQCALTAKYVVLAGEDGMALVDAKSLTLRAQFVLPHAHTHDHTCSVAVDKGEGELCILEDGSHLTLFDLTTAWAGAHNPLILLQLALSGKIPPEYVHKDHTRRAIALLEADRSEAVFETARDALRSKQQHQQGGDQPQTQAQGDGVHQPPPEQQQQQQQVQALPSAQDSLQDSDHLNLLMWHAVVNTDHAAALDLMKELLELPPLDVGEWRSPLLAGIRPGDFVVLDEDMLHGDDADLKKELHSKSEPGVVKVTTQALRLDTEWFAELLISLIRTGDPRFFTILPVRAAVKAMWHSQLDLFLVRCLFQMGATAMLVYCALSGSLLGPERTWQKFTVLVLGIGELWQAGSIVRDYRVSLTSFWYWNSFARTISLVCLGLIAVIEQPSLQGVPTTLALSLLFHWVGLLEFTFAFDGLARAVIAITHVIRRCASFLLVLAVAAMAAASCMFVLFGDTTSASSAATGVTIPTTTTPYNPYNRNRYPFTTPSSASKSGSSSALKITGLTLFDTAIHLMFGQLSASVLDNAGDVPSATRAILLAIITLALIVLLSMLIAVVFTAYERIQDGVEPHLARTRAIIASQRHTGPLQLLVWYILQLARGGNSGGESGGDGRWRNGVVFIPADTPQQQEPRGSGWRGGVKQRVDALQDTVNVDMAKLHETIAAFRAEMQAMSMMAANESTA
ncbi:WD-repeat protein [Salpingoeca rosetta]|uniref:WD-repeat protein n=1 Tax=Salpingoeca rosetta (strain ATCC 50818 / BSB-021) TaxID=946362 RepID=F2UQB4_SALR5|nr:WD-repeat protein [Salpingoeca rosetta]EGD79782.1 WD-repeat protein [Salpingoeca rosetta]|eukprot:XP_004988731.1 WD-repeat protein [Salpingoeca rosetta]